MFSGVDGISSAALDTSAPLPQNFILSQNTCIYKFLQCVMTKYRFYIIIPVVMNCMYYNSECDNVVYIRMEIGKQLCNKNIIHDKINLSKTVKQSYFQTD